MKYKELFYLGTLLWSFAGSPSVKAQDDAAIYLASHHYAFSLEKGFDGALSDTLQRRLKGYRLILQAEGGSHHLRFYSSLEPVWIKFLQQRFGLRHFVGESGPASAILFSQYLDTGDSTLILNRSPFWKTLYAYNADLPAAQQLRYVGLDFDWPRYYFTALKVLLPDATIPDEIRESIYRIQAASDMKRDCDSAIAFNERLKKDLQAHKASFAAYFRGNYFSFEQIVLNPSNCRDERKNRNPKMAARFFDADSRIGDSLYFGEFGMAHTLLNTDDLASMINRTEPFRNKVCVINLYCYNCTVPGEEVSNWPLRKMENDITRYFLPLCKSGFTLFDLSEDSPVTKPWRAFGQFLIVARDQL